MVADPEMWEAFYDHLRKKIAELRDELVPYEEGTFEVARRPHGGDWENITKSRIAQIKREIESLENTLKRFGQSA
jgi:hypothetical protein